MSARGFIWANVSRVTDQLWVGGDLEVFDEQLAARQLDELDAAGLTDIVDVRLEWNDEDWVKATKPALGYHWLGVDDAGQRMPDEWFDTGTEHVLRQLRNGGTVLAHCHMGINRGPSMGFAVLLSLGWDPLEALDAIRSARPIAYIGYAEDALDWWCSRNDLAVRDRNDMQRKLHRWRVVNELDVEGIIRTIRQQEQSSSKPAAS